MADGRTLKARYQTTDDLQVTLQAPHGRIRFRVAFVILPGSDDVMIIGSKTLRESLDLNIVQTFHQRISEVGELFAAPDSAARADENTSSLRRVSGPGLPCKECCRLRRGMLCRTRRMSFVRRLYRSAWLCL